MASGFSQMMLLPAAAAASTISLCVALGVQMSICWMSSRAISLRQSVSYDSYPHVSANALSFSGGSTAQMVFRTGLVSSGKKLLTLR